MCKWEAGAQGDGRGGEVAVARGKAGRCGYMTVLHSQPVLNFFGWHYK